MSFKLNILIKCINCKKLFIFTYFYYKSKLDGDFHGYTLLSLLPKLKINLKTYINTNSYHCGITNGLQENWLGYEHVMI